MSLQDFDVSGLRALSESAMLTPCKIIRTSGTTFDPVTNTSTRAADLIWEGGCRITRPGLEISFGEVAAALVPIQSYVIKVPVDAGPIRGGDFLQTGEGRVFHIQGAGAETWQVHQDLQATEVPSFEVVVT